MTKNYDIAVLGDWHLAFVTASVLADVGHKVALVNPLMSQKAWNEFPPIPVSEPGLNEMILRNQKAGRLFFENAVNENWQAEKLWLAVDTPINDKDEPDTASLIEILKNIQRTQKKSQLLAISSQVPMGFGQQAEAITGLPVAYVPENLRLGKGIETFFNADRTVIGAQSEATLVEMKKILKDFKTEFLCCNLPTAEMVKHANNIFLATSISFANELARIGEKFAVDSQVVGQALKLDKRIGPMAYVSPGLGFAGGTLPRDLRVIQKLGKEKSVPTPLVDAVLSVNENTTQALADTVINHVKGSGPVLLMGYTYKADTDTLRRSLTLDLAGILKQKNIQCLGFDPVMNEKDLSAINGLIEHCNQIEQIKNPVQMIVVMTARPQFRELNWAAIKEKTAANCMVFDTQNIIAADLVLKAKMNFKKIWSPEMRNL